MRKDENGDPCPETLGEYRKMVAAIAGEDSRAVKWLDGEIERSPGGENEVVVAHDHQMRMILFPMMVPE